MTYTLSSNIMTSGDLAEFIRRKAIRNFQPNVYFMDLGMRKDLPVGYNTYTFPTVDSMSGSVASLTEGTTPSESSFNLTNVTVSLEQYGAHVVLSDVVMTDAPVDAIGEAAVELWADLANKVDAAIQDVIDAGTNVLYGGDATARTELATGDDLTAGLLAKVYSLLEANNAPKYSGGNYVAVIHPHVSYDLKTETSTGAFIDVNKYAKPDTILNGEIGTLNGVRLVISSNIQKYVDGGASGANVYPTFVMGRNAYGVVTSGGMQSFYEGLGSAGTADPLHQRSTVGVKMRLGTAILKQDALYRIETTSALGNDASGA